MVDEFHRMWDVVTEFGSLSGLASQLVPGEPVGAAVHRAVHGFAGAWRASGACKSWELGRHSWGRHLRVGTRGTHATYGRAGCGMAGWAKGQAEKGRKRCNTVTAIPVTNG